MLGHKIFTSLKIEAGLFLLVILLVLLISRNSQPIVRAFAAYGMNWKTADYKQFETQHFTIKYLPGDENYIEVIGETAEDAYSKVGDMLDYQPVSKTPIIIYADSASLADSFGWDKDEKAMGVYWAGTIRILSPQVWIKEEENWKHIFASKGPVYHEFAHLLVDDITNGNYSRWFTEGIAQYVEKKLTGFEFKNPFYDGLQIEYYEFARLENNFDELNQQIAYWESLQAVEYLVENYEEQSLLDILNCLGQGYSMDQAVNRVVGIDYSVFESDFYKKLNNIQG